MSRNKGQALGSIFADLRREPPVEVATPPALSAFLAVVDRVEAVLDAETRALAQRVSVDLTEIGNRKRQGLLDMTRMLSAAAAGGSVAEGREIADIVAQSIRDAESDGTYSPRMRRS